MGKPESHFSKRSLRRYKAVRKAMRVLEVPEAHAFIPGRVRGTDLAYAEVRRYTGVTKYDYRRFYFHKTPKKKEVEQVLELMVEALDE